MRTIKKLAVHYIILIHIVRSDHPTSTLHYLYIRYVPAHILDMLILEFLEPST